MGAVAVFDPAAWALAYPKFASSPPGLATSWFSTATLYWRNDGTGPVQTVDQQTSLLWLLTAHIAALTGQGASGLVGRINSATEGSVSVSSELDVPMGAAWFAQTPYGLMFWQATAGFRTMQWRPGRQPIFDPIRRWR